MTPEEEIKNLKGEIVNLLGYKARIERMELLYSAGLVASSMMLARGFDIPDEEEIGHISKYMKMGMDFEILMKSVNSDETLKSEWDRFCVALKLVEY